MYSFQRRRQQIKGRTHDRLQPKSFRPGEEHRHYQNAETYVYQEEDLALERFLRDVVYETFERCRQKTNKSDAASPTGWQRSAETVPQRLSNLPWSPGIDVGGTVTMFTLCLSQA